MASKESEVGTDVVKMMTSLTTATEIAGKLASIANEMCDTVTAVAEKSHQTLMELTKEAASVAAAEVRDFQEAMRNSKASGEGVRVNCLELMEKWNCFEASVYSSFVKKQINKEDVQNCISQLQLLLECAAVCAKNYQVFEDNLHDAIRIGALLSERCRKASEDAKSKASNTRFAGYGVAGTLGVTALGFLTFATGGLAAVGAAAAGAAAAGTGAYTCDRAGKLDKLAAEFDGLRNELNESLRDLNKLGDQITGLFKVTEGMVQNMEIALKFFQEQEKLRQEKDQTKASNEKLIQEQERLRQEQEETKTSNQKLLQESEDAKRRNEELEKRIQQLEAANSKK